jgi:hypothetical protein
VRFVDAPPGRGSEAELRLVYRSAGAALIGPLLRKISEHEIREDLRHFKQWMEAGEVPTTEGQPSGRTRKASGAEERPEAGRPEMRRVRRSSVAAAQAQAQEGGA